MEPFFNYMATLGLGEAMIAGGHGDIRHCSLEIEKPLPSFTNRSVRNSYGHDNIWNSVFGVCMTPSGH